MAKDFYDTLGVPRTATADEIKKAYRRLAKQYHPDVNKGDKGAEDRFKEISAAYDVLSDAKQRRQYDMLGQAFPGGGGPGPGGFQWGAGNGPGGFRWQTTGGAEGAPGFEGLGDLFSEIFGFAGPRRPGRTAPGQDDFGGARGEDLSTVVEIDLLEAVQGATRQIQLDRGGRRERISVKIPPGVSEGQKIRVAGKGARGRGATGDLWLEIRIRPDPRFTRDGADLLVDLPITFYEAILGGEVTIPTLTGSAKMKLPSGTASGQKFRLKGKGLPMPGQSGVTGDLYAVVQIVPPPRIEPALREWAETFARESPYDPRK